MNPNLIIVPTPEAKAMGESYQPHGAQRQLFAGHPPEIIVYGGTGTGKTRAHLELLNLRSVMYPRSRGLMLRLTRSSLAETGIVTMETEVIAPSQRVQFHGGERRTKYTYPNGSVIVVAGLDDPDSAQSIMSGQFNWIHVIECTQVGERAWSALSTRLRNPHSPYTQLVGCCNPSPDSWVTRRAARGDCVLVKTTHADNPTLTDEYLARLDKLKGDQARSYREGEWGRAGGSVQRMPNLVTLPKGGY
jgi:phage terminase large subunit